MTAQAIRESRCWCGKGCDLRSRAHRSNSDPRCFSEADAIANYERLYGVGSLGAVTDEPVETDVEARQTQGPADPARSARHAEAVAYIAGYTGRFGLILDLRADRRWGSKWFR